MFTTSKSAVMNSTKVARSKNQKILRKRKQVERAAKRKTAAGKDKVEGQERETKTKEDDKNKIKC